MKFQINEAQSVKANVNKRVAISEFNKAVNSLEQFVISTALPKVDGVVVEFFSAQPVSYAVDINWLEETMAQQRLSATITVTRALKFTDDDARLLDRALYRVRGLTVAGRVTAEAGAMKITIITP